MLIKYRENPQARVGKHRRRERKGGENARILAGGIRAGGPVVSLKEHDEEK
jgi:hypothetical protein